MGCRGLAGLSEFCSLSRMANDRIAVPYNGRLTRLETLLAGVKRAGDFFVQGSLDAPIPHADIDGVGVLSFPVPASQIEAVIKRACRAPYGRGEHTIVDTSTRNAWQLDSADVRIGGKAWEKTFNQIMSTVIAGLGCSGMKVSAKLYKLLVYETGGLFRPHRDTEKVDGMFGTLVVVRGESAARAATAGSCGRSCSIRSSERIAFACARIGGGICTSRSSATVWIWHTQPSAEGRRRPSSVPKPRGTYERHCAEHNADVMAMATLLRVIDGARGELATLAARMADATGCELERG